jgi:molecular chaperone DnaJ
MSTETLEQSKSYYELLEVPQGASDEDIKRAYRRLALKHHPDRSGMPERRLAELRFRLIHEAYLHIKTQEKRALYNNNLRGGNDNARKNSFWAQVADIFKNPAEKSRVK